jgi:hypothetical protein
MNIFFRLVNIEVIHASTDERKSNGKFHITTTGSSINVISGDISEIPVIEFSSFFKKNIILHKKVDMMICISTSNNLRDSILDRAGPEIESQYKQSAKSDDALLLNGGSTRAQKILFVPWQTEIQETETTKTQKSLSELVKWCIEQAKQRDLKSISFPPVRDYSFSHYKN